MDKRPYYIQTRNQEQEIVGEQIDYLADGDNIILDREGYVILVIRYNDLASDS